jgi:hypothetical protein
MLNHQHSNSLHFNPRIQSHCNLASPSLFRFGIHHFNMRFFAMTALLGLSVSALPTVENSVVARSASPEAIAEAVAESARLYARGKDIKYASMPSSNAACPATARYGAHTYTDNQIKVAFLGGAGLTAEGKQLGTSMYSRSLGCCWC